MELQGDTHKLRKKYGFLRGFTVNLIGNPGRWTSKKPISSTGGRGTIQKSPIVVQRGPHFTHLWFRDSLNLKINMTVLYDIRNKQFQKSMYENKNTKIFKPSWIVAPWQPFYNFRLCCEEALPPSLVQHLLMM